MSERHATSDDRDLVRPMRLDEVTVGWRLHTACLLRRSGRGAGLGFVAGNVNGITALGTEVVFQAGGCFGF